MKRFVLARPAERDLESIKNFLLQDAGAAVARKVVGDLRSAIAFLNGEPGAGHTREDLTDLPLKFWPVYSYPIVYDPKSAPLRVIRILHGNRDVESILN